MKNLIKKEEINRDKNRKYRTLIKNAFKKVNLIDKNNDDHSEIKKIISNAQKIIDKSVTKVIHKNNASRKKSQLFRIFNSLVS